MSIREYSRELNSQKGIKAFIKKKLFGNLLKVLEEQENRLTEQENRLTDQESRLNVFLNHFGDWKEIPVILENDGVIPKKEYLSEYGEERKKQNSSVFYYNLSNVFRGPEDEIHKTVEFFLSYIIDAVKSNPTLPFIDFGCGRGEFLDVLKKNNIYSIGIDVNKESAKVAIENGHEVRIENAIDFLKYRGGSSISGLSMIMVSEHISFEDMFSNIFLFSSKIAEGGPLLINTINPYCYERYGNFHLDPSHINYLPPEIYKLVMEMAGFQNIRIVWSVPIRKYTVGDLHTQYENVTLIGYRK